MTTLTPIFPSVIDSSMRASFAACPRQFFYSYLCGLSSKRLSIHLHFGACFAHGLEIYRRVFYGPGVAAFPLHEKHHLALANAFNAIIREWGDYPVDAEEPKTLWNCLGALDYYFETFAPATDNIQPFIKDDGEPAVEFSFTLPMGLNNPATGEPLIYAGRFDMLGVHAGSLVVVDEKTTKQLGPTWSSSWDMRAQFKGYNYAARHYGYPTMGAVVRGVALRKTGYDHAEAIVPAPQWDLERWWIQLHRDVERMIHLWEEDYWDMNLDASCTSYGGCGFSVLCKVKDPEPWISSTYTVRRWNPLSADPLREAREAEAPLLERLL